MQNQLVDFRTAKIAKENGFNELVKDCFFVKEDKVVEKSTLVENGALWKDFNKQNNYISRPTYLLLQKWMRRKGIDIPDLHFLQLMPSDKKATYLIYDRHTGYHKIGRSKSPFQREQTLAAQQPDNELIAITPVDIENKLKRKYKHLRRRGEWFNLSIRDVLEVKEIFRTSL